MLRQVKLKRLSWVSLLCERIGDCSSACEKYLLLIVMDTVGNRTQDLRIASNAGALNTRPPTLVQKNVSFICYLLQSFTYVFIAIYFTLNSTVILDMNGYYSLVFHLSQTRNQTQCMYFLYIYLFLHSFRILIKPPNAFKLLIYNLLVVLISVKPEFLFDNKTAGNQLNQPSCKCLPPMLSSVIRRLICLSCCTRPQTYQKTSRYMAISVVFYFDAYKDGQIRTESYSTMKFKAAHVHCTRLYSKCTMYCTPYMYCIFIRYLFLF